MIEHVDEAILKVIAAGAGKAIVGSGKPESDEGTIRLDLLTVAEDVSRRANGLEVVRAGDEARIRRGAMTLRLEYLVTARGKDATEEHRLLSSAFLALVRQPSLPGSDLPQALVDLGAGAIEIAVAQPDSLAVRAPVEMWRARGEPMRASLGLTATLTVNPFESRHVRLVREMLLGMGQGLARSGFEREISLRERRVSIAGLVEDAATGRPLSGAIVESTTGRRAVTDERGLFHLDDLAPGRQSVAVRRDGYAEESFEAKVPPPGRSDLLEPQIVVLRSLRPESALPGGEERSAPARVEVTGSLDLGAEATVAYVPVRIAGVVGMTDADGVYRLSGIEPGRHGLEARIPGKGWTLVPGKEDVDVV